MAINLLFLAYKGDTAYCLLCVINTTVLCSPWPKRDTPIMRPVSIFWTSIYDISYRSLNRGNVVLKILAMLKISLQYIILLYTWRHNFTQLHTLILSAVSMQTLFDYAEFRDP